MKKNKYIKWILPIGIALLMASCIDDDLNNNPTSSTNMDPNLQITTVQLLHSNDAEVFHRFFIYPGGFMNQWCNDWSTMNFGGTGQKSDAYFPQLWDTYYPQIILNVVDLVERTKNVSEYQNIHAISKILRVEHFLRLTDFYGDIPYSEAGLAYYTGIFKPKYDKQEDIYNDFFVELAAAADLLDSSKPPMTGDLYYNGDITKWKKYANSLRLRIAMRLIKVNPAKAKTEAEAAVAAGVFTSNADICYVQHDNVQTTSASAGNGVANRLLADNKSSQFRLTTELIGTMEELKDPRILYYASSYLEDGARTDITPQLLARYNSYKAFTLGAQHFGWSTTSPVSPVTISVGGQNTEVPALLQYLQPSKLITNPGSPNIRMSYAEVEFLLAEAVQRGYSVGGTTDSHFQSGLDAAVRQWTIFGGTINEANLQTFKDANHLKSGSELLQINTQLWILHFLDPFETWSNWRRTGLPDIKFYNYRPSSNQSGGKTPRRIQYPVSEQTSNPEGYKSAVDRLTGGDDWMSRIWWDKE